jgi:hypothetical protein
MSGRHKAQRESVTIVRTTEITGDIEKEARRPYIKQIVKEGVKFPILQRRIRAATKTFKSVFKANRPNLFA